MAQWIDKTYDVDDGTGNVATKWKIMSVMFNGDKGILVFNLGGFIDDTRVKPVVLKHFPIRLDSGFITPREIGDLEQAVGAILMRLPFFEGASASAGTDIPNLGARIPNAFLPKNEELEIDAEPEIKKEEESMRMIEPEKLPEPAPVKEESNVALKIAAGAAAGAALLYGVMQVLS
jgi:hypothetical protein